MGLKLLLPAPCTHICAQGLFWPNRLLGWAVTVYVLYMHHAHYCGLHGMHRCACSRPCRLIFLTRLYYCDTQVARRILHIYILSVLDFTYYVSPSDVRGGQHAVYESIHDSLKKNESIYDVYSYS